MEVWQRVLSRPPKRRWPRFFSSAPDELRVDLRRGGDMAVAEGGGEEWSAEPFVVDVSRRGRLFESVGDEEDCRRLSVGEAG